MTASKTNSVVSSSSTSQIIRNAITSAITNSFPNTLGTVRDIVNIVMAQFYYESGFNAVNSQGPQYSASHQRTLLGYPAVASKYASASAQEKANIINSNRAFGLGQVTGSYIIIGADPNGKGELYRMNPSLAGPLMVQPGVNVASILNGVDNIPKQVLAGLIVLDYYFRGQAQGLVSAGKFSSKIAAALGLYLGLGTDSNGTTPGKYIGQIIGGPAYTKANGPNAIIAVGNSGTNASGPATTPASGNNLSMPGC